MPTPSPAELLQALREIRQAAERLKGYDADRVARLEAAIGAHRGAIARAAAGPGDVGAPCERIDRQCGAVLESIGRARQYRAHIMARADVLDRTGMLAKMVRDLAARLEPPAAS